MYYILSDTAELCNTLIKFGAWLIIANTITILLSIITCNTLREK